MLAPKIVDYKYRLSRILLLAIIALPYGVRAEEGFRLDADNRFSIGFGLSRVEFDTKIRFTDKQLNVPVFIDGEGTLGLPEVSNVNTVFASVRLAERHSLRAAYFSVQRENNFAVSDLALDELHVIDARVSLRDETRFLDIDYGYNIFRDYRSRVDVLFGIYVLDLKYVFEASGEYEVGGTIESGTYRLDAQAVAPVPDIGLHVDFAITPKWSIGARFAMIQGSYGEISARAYRTAVRAKYMTSRNFAADIGVSYFDADVTIDEDARKTEVGYGYNGLFAGVHLEF